MGILKKLKTEIWAIGIARAQPHDFLSAPLPNDITWIEPKKSFTFFADPHGIWKDDKLYVFVEALDYRFKKGVIECFVLDQDLNILEHLPVMEDETHLSYPFIIEEKGEIYMIPESSRSGKAWIYKAENFPIKWKKIHEIMPDVPMIDASFVHHNDMWWAFYALPGAGDKACRELHIAYAENLLGPWKTHANNPVSNDIEQSRPGGRPFIHKDKIHLPVQNCSVDYGGSLNILRIDEISPQKYKATKIAAINPEFHPDYPDGLHTLSGCDFVTLFDCKSNKNDPYRNIINWQRRLGRFLPFLPHL